MPSYLRFHYHKKVVNVMYSNIYVITNKINNKQYVGQSVEVEKRWCTHKNPKSQTVIMLDKEDNIIMEFHSIGEASRYLNKEYDITINSKNRIQKVLDTDKISIWFYVEM